ncbi:MAG: class I SAM-dependent methyltransferase [Phycisphaerales bacterium]|nr:class I SAM-dependent methyltransferase [Phycisphaerales bacterium]
MPPHGVLHRYYSEPAQRQSVVNGLFDDSARYYDRVTGLMCLGTGLSYRRQALRRVGVGPGSRVLDVACGTGQVSRAAIPLVGPTGYVLGVDPSTGMRRVAAARGVTAVEGTADRLPAADASVDVVVMGYALRHAADLRAAFREMRRVLRPGGVVLILEITAPAAAPARFLLRLYLEWIVPPATWLLTGSRRARDLMSYYWDSIDRCVPPAMIMEAMRESGLMEVERRRCLGVFNEYSGRAPVSRP